MQELNTSEALASAKPVPTEAWKPAKYRPDIDGLRALAILAVVAFHISPSWIRGGFIGVDIFFVISGFLISTVILGNLNAGRFRFRDFYARRIRRIFPALVVTMIAVLAAGWIAMLADEYTQLGKHVVSASVFAANFLYWKESNYFDQSATKPLLHLWSLGVEEQYYLIWPLMLWACWKRKLNLLAVISAMGVLSFGVNIWIARSAPSAAFYLPHTRFWELLIGSALACAALQAPSGPSSLAWLRGSASAFTGLALIVAGLALINGDKAFPGWWALLPVLGAALIIAAGPGAWLNRAVLSHPAMVLCGLISYPLYLWHWPILAFLRVIKSEEPPLLVRIGVAFVSFLLAWITYQYVERPLRFGAGARNAVRVLASGMIMIAGAGLLIYRAQGFEGRAAAAPQLMHPGDDGHEAAYRYLTSHFYPCTPAALLNDALTYEGTPRCRQSLSDRPVDVAIIGDSHAEALFSGLAQQFPKQNVAYYIKPTLPLLSDPEFRAIFRYVLGDRNIKTVILTADWYPKLPEVRRGSSFGAELTATVEALRRTGKTVLLAGDVPTFSFDPKQCKYSRRFSSSNCLEDSAHFQRNRETYYSTLMAIAKSHPGVRALDLGAFFCNSHDCSMADGADLLYEDNNHLNLNGSRYVARKLAEQIGPSLIFN